MPAVAPAKAKGTSTRASLRGATAKDKAPRRPTRTAPKPSKKAATVTSRPVDDPLKERALQSAERDLLTTRIATLKAQIAAGEKSRTGAAAALSKAERALADVNHRIEELAQRQRAAHERIAALDRQRAGADEQIGIRRTDFAQVANHLYANQDVDPARTWFAGGDPNEKARTDVYLGYVLRAQAAGLDALRGKALDLRAQRQRADDDTKALAEQAEAQRSARESLAADQASQRQALATMSQQLARQRGTANALEADEKRLARVVEQLQRVIDRQAAEERARREAARKVAEQQAAAAARRNRDASPKGGDDVAPRTREPAPPVRVDAVPDAASGNGAFARLRGQLRLPVRGSIIGRFGAPRGDSGATWKGVFVRTETGADVRAVAAGRVVFADDLRGFGNLLIVDHGDQYLSIYGNNEALLKHAGDAVGAGDVISRSGNSSGDDQTGLYFELRFRGRPFDPMTWTGGR